MCIRDRLSPGRGAKVLGTRLVDNWDVLTVIRNECAHVSEVFDGTARRNGAAISASTDWTLHAMEGQAVNLGEPCFRHRSNICRRAAARPGCLQRPARTRMPTPVLRSRFADCAATAKGAPQSRCHATIRERLGRQKKLQGQYYQATAWHTTLYSQEPQAAGRKPPRRGGRRLHRAPPAAIFPSEGAAAGMARWRAAAAGLSLGGLAPPAGFAYIW